LAGTLAEISERIGWPPPAEKAISAGVVIENFPLSAKMSASSASNGWRTPVIHRSMRGNIRT
jgi:hypothetical protein